VANISVAGRKVEIKRMVEGNGRAYLSISGTLDRLLLKLMSCRCCRGGCSIAFWVRGTVEGDRGSEGLGVGFDRLWWKRSSLLLIRCQL
jgi:hypothetical protein